ncbi:MAG TPA: hypothetical protein VH414_05180 [Lichenihabitans sp.]|jgi:hypothetical protein|nr:hypothetical protein [Lichenihabitans sp.]
MDFRFGLLRLGLMTMLLWPCGAQASPAGEPLPPNAFAPPILDGVARRAEPATPGLQSYRFEGGRDWPALRFHAATPLDWRRAGALAFDVENPSDTPFPLLLRLDDDFKADGGDRSLTGTTVLAPHARVTLVLPLDPDAPTGMRGRPPGRVALEPGDQLVGESRGSVDLGHIVALHVSGTRLTDDHTLLIGPPMLRPAGEPPSRPAPLADVFGQWTQGTWPENVSSIADLRAKLATATAQTRRLARTLVPTADAYGGVDASVRLPATGFFRTAKVGGRWALITPAGHRFFSLGVDSVATSNPTIVGGRAQLFTGLTSAEARDPAATIDVGEANLERGLGAGWRERWPGEVLGRLKAWGFNTLGNWSDPGLARDAHMAYVSFTDVEGDSAMVPMSGGRSLADPFDPRFAAVADAIAATMTAGTRDDPYLIGYFSGNELPWGRPDRPDDGIAAHVMALGAASPAKRALVDGLRGRYGTVEALAAAYGLAVPVGWDTMLSQPFAWPMPPTEAARRDMAGFGGRFADLYFETVRAALKRHDPNHLYLGTRLAAYPPEVMAACARWCDVISLNLYARTPEAEAAAWRSLDRPVLIGEFHFGSTDRGSFWPGMVAVETEAARGPAYAAYVAAAVADPAIVGVHWYQYADEPLTGRPYDGENGHIGLVAVTDIPFAGFVEAVATANRAALEVFAGQGRPAAAAERLGLRGTQ